MIDKFLELYPNLSWWSLLELYPNLPWWSLLKLFPNLLWWSLLWCHTSLVCFCQLPTYKLSKIALSISLPIHLHVIRDMFIIPPSQQSCRGLYWFHSVRPHYNTILSLDNMISRHYKKSLLRSQIYHGFEELSTDTNYPIWRRQERRSKYAVQLASWQLRSNSPKTYVCPSVCPASSVRSVAPTVLVGSISYLHILSSNFRRCVAC